MQHENIPSRRDAHLRPVPDGFIAARGDPRLKEPGVVMELAGVAAFRAGMISNLTAAIGGMAMTVSQTHTIMMDIAAFTIATWVGSFLPSFAIIAAGSVAGTLRAYDRRVIRSAADRVLGLINDGHGFTGDEAEGHFARTVICNLDDWTGGRSLLMRLDAVAVQHAETQKRIEHDPAKCSVARGIARDACYGMIAEFREDHGDRSVDGEIEDLSRACRAIATGRSPDAPIAMHAPTARIGRIISTAERMLSHRPDLTDAGGARIDALVRIHVPRLLERHRIAAETASPDALEEVDARLDIGVERIRSSVQEAADAVHDEAMRELATELRFLELRRTPSTALPDAAS